MSPPKSELASLFLTFWSHKNAEPSPRVELGASLAHSGRKQPAKRSTSPIKMWIQRVSVIIPGPCCPDKYVASEKIEVQLVTLGNLGIPLVATLCFYFCTARTDWFIFFSHVDVKLLLEANHFQTWLEKRKGPNSVWLLHVEDVENDLVLPQTQTAMLQYSLFTFPSPNQPCSIDYPHLQTQTQTFLDVSGVLQVPKCLGATKARLTIPKWSVSILIANRLGVWNQQQPGHVALTQCFFSFPKTHT